MTVKLKLIVVSQKYQINNLLFQSIKELLNQGIGISLSRIRDTKNLKHGKYIITEKEKKLLLIEFLSKSSKSSKSIIDSFFIKLECKTRFTKTPIN